MFFFFFVRRLGFHRKLLHLIKFVKYDHISDFEIPEIFTHLEKSNLHVVYFISPFSLRYSELHAPASQ